MPVEIFDPTAERILRTGAIADDQLTIYQVPVGFNFYLEECSLLVSEEAGTPADSFCYLYWEQAITAYYVRDLCQIWFWEDTAKYLGAQHGDHAVFPSCLIIPAGDLIIVYSDDETLLAEGNISGFLVSDYA